MPTHKTIRCPKCGSEIKTFSNPVPTVDVIIEYEGGIVLVLRKDPPPGWALPGGFVDYGETVEEAARREAREETNLDLSGLTLFSVYSDPGRDPRMHTITTVFVATGTGRLKEGDDAARVHVFAPDRLPEDMAFDHGRIIADYRFWKHGQDRNIAKK
jgi:ADP-ribose pyrophosphatase YjhB (NUDIX family)